MSRGDHQGRTRADQRQRSREALLAAGYAEFAERGLDAPSLDSICSRAGYTRGAFYVHFESRDDFLAAVMERALGHFVDIVASTSDQARDLERAVEGFTVRAWEQFGPQPNRKKRSRVRGGAELPFHYLIDACRRVPVVRERFARLIEEAQARLATTIKDGQEAEVVRRELDARRTASLLVVMALGVLTTLSTGASLDVAELQSGVMGLLTPTR